MGAAVDLDCGDHVPTAGPQIATQLRGAGTELAYRPRQRPRADLAVVTPPVPHPTVELAAKQPAVESAGALEQADGAVVKGAGHRSGVYAVVRLQRRRRRRDTDKVAPFQAERVSDRGDVGVHGLSAVKTGLGQVAGAVGCTGVFVIQRGQQMAELMHHSPGLRPWDAGRERDHVAGGTAMLLRVDDD